VVSGRKNFQEGLLRKTKTPLPKTKTLKKLGDGRRTSKEIEEDQELPFRKKNLFQMEKNPRKRKGTRLNSEGTKKGLEKIGKIQSSNT